MNTSNNRKRKLSEEEDENAEDLELTEEGGTFLDDIYIPPPIIPSAIANSSDRRVIITKISNTFFKSYAETQVLGPFCKCFNAIVGPNGSGKSNVIDAMLFVFGYRAAKIRSKKVSVLLHNSDKYRNVNSCTVSVHFTEIIDKEEDSFEIVPDSEFIVSRTALKDNSSFYEINGTRVQFKAVAELLKKHNIDLNHNRFLILQGEVEQIAMMKCKAENDHETGMLEYLEDIIGTDRYKKPLIQLEEKVEVLSEKRTEKLNRLKIVEKELQELREPMEEATEFLKNENIIVKCKHFLYQKDIYETTQELKEIEKEKLQVESVQEKVVKKLEELTLQKTEKQSVLRHKSAKYDNLIKRQNQLKESFEQADKKDTQLQADMSEMVKNRKKNRELLGEKKRKMEKLQLIPDKNINMIKELENKEKELLGKKEKLDKEKSDLLLTLRSETKDLQEEKEKLQTKLVQLEKVVDETKSEYTLAESELKIFIEKEGTERNKFEKLKEDYENSEMSISRISEKISELKSNIPLKENNFKSINNEFIVNQRKVNEITDKIQRNKANVEEMKSCMEASRSRGRVLDSLMDQKLNGNCSGLFGRLGDLGAIDKKYDVAISTACGPLDNIVVDTVETAQWCIEFLKKHGIGRATFIALDKQEYLRNTANTRIKTPENVSRLFDLIKIQDEKVKTAFYFALRDTLVANDLDQATRVAFGAQRYRVVTLNGDLLETSGTMSGGGKTVSRGRMGQSVATTTTTTINPKEVQNIEKDLENLTQQLNKLRNEQMNLEEQKRLIELELKQMKIDYQRYTMELQQLNEQKPKLHKQLKQQEIELKESKSNPKQVEKLKKIINNKKKSYEEAEEIANKLRVKVDKITNEIKEKTFNTIGKIDKKIKETNNTIEKCHAEIVHLRAEIKTSERNVKKIMEEISTMEKKIEDTENRLRKMKAIRDEIEVDAKKLTTCIEEIALQLTDGEGDYSDIKKEISDITKQENKLKTEKVDIDQNFKVLQKKIDDYNIFIKQKEFKKSKLQLHKIFNESVDELVDYSIEELNENNREPMELKLQNAEKKMKTAKPNLTAIEDFRKKQNVFIDRSKELEDITAKRSQVKEFHDKLKIQRKNEFLTGYATIRMKLKEMYQMITLGGDADFELVDTFDPFTEGIQFKVRPPKKTWKNISNLSGGEKTLSSLALVFALHYFKPSPLYVMDEIDAALDFKNVSIVGHYIKERTKNAQFIIISLRSNMFELCDNMIGIYKTFNTTKTITLNIKKLQEKVQEE